MGFQRDNILTPEERAASARKCLNLLEDKGAEHMRQRDYEFLIGQRAEAKSLRYAPSEPQLQWLRDLVDRLVTL